MPRAREDRLSPRRRPRQRRAQETVDVILDAAARIFAQRGYAAASTNRIAERAGVSVGSLYEYFPAKESLLAALLERHVADGRRMLALLDAVASATGSLPPLEQLTRSFVDAMLALHATDPALHRVLFEESRLDPRLRAALDDLEDDLVTATAAILRAHPEVRVGDPIVAARVVVQIVESLTHKVVIHPRPGDDPIDFAATITDLVTGYLTTSRAGSR